MVHWENTQGFLFGGVFTPLNTKTSPIDLIKELLFEKTQEEAMIGDVKASLATADHGTWFLLDGRDAVAGLSAEALANARAMGITTVVGPTEHLLDMSTGYTGGTGTKGVLTGSNTANLTASNLPDTTLVVDVSQDGSHAHTGTTDNVNGGSTKTTNNNGNHTHKVYSEENPTAPGTELNDRNQNAGNPGIDRTKNTSSSGDHTHTVNIDHTHDFSTSSDGLHGHAATVDLNPTGQVPMNVEPRHLAVNWFVSLVAA